MKGDAEIIVRLNQVLTNELTAINQYFVHAKMCANWGFNALAAHARAESIDEMKHADLVIDRVLYLEGIPNLQRLGKVTVGENVPEQFQLDLKVEGDAITYLNESIAVCRQKGDNGTAELFTAILTSEEEHFDWLETQLALIEHIGVERYLADKMG